MWADPGEHNNIITDKTEIWKTLLARMEEVEKGVWSPYRGVTDKRACTKAIEYGGFWGPFIDV